MPTLLAAETSVKAVMDPLDNVALLSATLTGMHALALCILLFMQAMLTLSALTNTLRNTV